MTSLRMIILLAIAAALVSVAPACPQSQIPIWQAQVRKYADAQNWDAAMRLVNEEIARSPHDMDIRAWRARVFAWSGRTMEAEKEYREILKVSQTDPDNWMGLASVYLREGKVEAAKEAIARAEELDPKRADVHAVRARVLRAAGERDEARAEFQNALNLDPGSTEARDGLLSVSRETKHELRFVEDNDLLSYTSEYHDESVSLASKWTPRWTTNFASDLYQRAGVEAEKFAASVTLRQPRWGAITTGGAIGHDNAVIPKSEAFFDLDHGFKAGEASLLAGVEINYAQHWYWYQGARILTLAGGAIAYLPRQWTFSVSATGARSAFAGTKAEWRPSGLARLGFPLARWTSRRLSGGLFFAAGTEDFAVVDQIGRFASQTYGGGLKFQITAQQDVTGYAGYQKRTQNRTDTSFGLSYGIHF